MDATEKLSVVVPFYNEEGNIDDVLNEIAEVLNQLGKEWEIIAIDDGSRDGTPRLLSTAAQRIPRLRIITHPRNLGQSVAFWTGFRATRGDVIVTMDGDRQNDFRDVPAMLSLLDRVDAVFGQRVRRNDPIQKLVATRIAFFFRRVVLGDNMRDTACALKVMRKETLRALIPIRGFHRFIPFMFDQAGIPFTTCEVNHRPRVTGVTKYSLLKGYFFSTIVDLLFMWWYRIRNISQKCVKPED